MVNIRFRERQIGCNFSNIAPSSVVRLERTRRKAKGSRVLPAQSLGAVVPPRGSEPKRLALKSLSRLAPRQLGKGRLTELRNNCTVQIIELKSS